MKNFIIIILLLIIEHSITAQSLSDIANMKITDQEVQQKNNLVKTKKGYSDEYDFFINMGLKFYKKFISSQDASSCSFTPSCSVYAISAIKKEGFLLGYLNFWDRFSRCNSLNKKDYQIDKVSHLLIDPVRNFRYGKVE